MCPLKERCKTLDEWLEWYRFKSGDNRNLKELDKDLFYYDTEKGFVVLNFSEDLCYIEAMAGEYNKWLDVAEKEARKRGCDFVAGKAREGSNPKAFLRLYKRGIEIKEQNGDFILYKKVGDTD